MKMYQDYYNMYNPYYGFSEANYRSSEPQAINEEIITLNQAIGLIKQSVGNEKEDELFYDMLIQQAPSEKEKNITTPRIKRSVAREDGKNL